MIITLRIEPVLEKKLAAICRKKALSRSALIKSSLSAFLERQSAPLTPYELGKNLFGRVGSSHGRLSTVGNEYLRRKIREKNIG